jgi:serine/threonine-protein kinase
VFAQTGGVFAVPGAGGPAVLLLAVDRERGELALNPMTLPGGRDVLFTLVTSGANGNERVGRSVVVQTLGSSERRVAIEGGRDARYVARTGQLVYDDSGALMTVTFDAVRGRPTAAPQPVVPSVAHHPVNDSSNFAVAREGTLVYQPVTFPSTTLTWVDRDGRREPLGAPAQPYEYFRVSPDGTKIVTATRDQGQEIYVWDIASSSFTRITFNPEYDGYAIWTPDSKRIVFQSMAGGQQTIARKAIDGTGSTERLLAGGTDLVPPNSITADGSELIFRRIAPGATSELWSLPLDRAAAAKPLLVMEHDQQMNGEVSPDGRWLVYQSNESGRFEIYLRPFPEVDGGRWQVSSDGGFQPTWSRDGRALLYLTGSRLVEVEVSGGATPVIGAVHVALASIGSKPYDRSGRTYDVAPDGRLLVSEPLTAGPVTFDVVLSWDRAQR